MSDPTLIAFGHPLIHEPKSGTLARLTAEKNYYRRALTAALEGNEKMEWAADQCSRMRMTRPEDAIRYLRELHFKGLYRDLPLTQIETEMIRQGTAFVTLLAYRVVLKSIERELVALSQARRSSVSRTSPAT